MIVVDLPGHGRSGIPRDPARASVERTADDLAAILRRAGRRAGARPRLLAGRPDRPPPGRRPPRRRPPPRPREPVRRHRRPRRSAEPAAPPTRPAPPGSSATASRPSSTSGSASRSSPARRACRRRAPPRLRAERLRNRPRRPRRQPARRRPGEHGAAPRPARRRSVRRPSSSPAPWTRPAAPAPRRSPPASPAPASRSSPAPATPRTSRHRPIFRRLALDIPEGGPRRMTAAVTWTSVVDYEDIRYEHSGTGIAKVTIDRPEVHNAFRPETVEELIDAFARIRDDAIDRLRAADRRGRQGVLLGRRPALQGPRRLRRRRRARPPQRPGPPAPDPLAADPGHRPRQRLRHRWRPRPPRRVRPLDRRATTRSSARSARRSAASTPASGSGSWPAWSATRRPRRSGSCAASTTPPRRSTMGLVNRVVPLADLEAEGVAWARRDPGDEPDRDPLPQVGVPRRDRRPGRAPGVRRQRDRPLLHDRRGARGLDAPSSRSARPTSRKFPRRP